MPEQLPIIDAPRKAPVPARPVRAWMLHVCRVGICFAILSLIALQADRRQRAQQIADAELNYPIEAVLEVFSNAKSWGEFNLETASRNVLDDEGQPLGYVMQTSPDSDHIIGFSGPTNLLLIFNTDHQLLKATVIWTRDTKEHLQQVIADPHFMQRFDNISREQATQLYQVDGVSGATLTSLAIVQSVVHRLGGEAPALKFPEPLTLKDTEPFFEYAASITQDETKPALWHVFDPNRNRLGSLLRTSPAADNIVGYQGPTEALIGRDPDGKIVKILLRNSYDNEPYVGYFNQDWSFPRLFNDLTLEEVAKFDLIANEIEGVSGATMTSMTVAKGVIATAQDFINQSEQQSVRTETSLRVISLRDIGTIAVILLGVCLAFSKWRGDDRIRTAYQLLLIIYVGFINGDLLSQAMLVGWAENGIPLQTALSLVVITSVAFTFPVFTKRNVYCSHLCPHGAIQQLVKNRVRKPAKIPPKLRAALKLIPAVLLIWVVLVTMLNLNASLVDIEPFDAYLFQIAGRATIAVFVVGIIASLFSPLAYCKYGCPTGNLLEYLRRHRRSDKFTRVDAFSLMLLGLAALLYVS